MSLTMRNIGIALANHFHPSEIKVLTKGGKEMHYVTARVVMNRLDEVMGITNWWDEYTASEYSVQCRLTLRFPDGTTVTKADAGAYAGMSDEGDDDKSGYSDAFKRAAVKFGIGRFLYNDGVPIYPEDHVNGEVPNEPHLAKPQATPNLPTPKATTKEKHPNGGASGTGKYANDKQIATFLSKLKDKVGIVNGQWGDYWYRHDTKDWPDVKACTNDLVSVYGADGHLVKWLVETGQIDSDGLPDVGKPAQLGKLTAIVAHRGAADAKAMAAELDAYFVRTFEDKKAAIFRKHPELAPDGYGDEVVAATGDGEEWPEGRE